MTSKPVVAAVGATSQSGVYHVDNGAGAALCRPDYALDPQTTLEFRDEVPGVLVRCGRNGCARAWNRLMGELGLKVLPHGNAKPNTVSRRARRN